MEISLSGGPCQRGGNGLHRGAEIGDGYDNSSAERPETYLKDVFFQTRYDTLSGGKKKHIASLAGHALFRKKCTRRNSLLQTPMPVIWGTTKHENHPHPSLPRRGGGIQGGGHFHVIKDRRWM